MPESVIDNSKPAARQADGVEKKLPQARRALLELLSDGHFHSGEALGAAIGRSRASVWKHIEALQLLGLDIHRVPGRGYRLAHPILLLDEDRIRAGLSQDMRKRCRLKVLESVDSTNAWLARQSDVVQADVVQPDLEQHALNVCVAEHQLAGRGRRGRQWRSPFGANLYFSVDWSFETLPRDFAAMSLVVGLAARAALADTGLPDVQLKWPNDLLYAGRKLGGILLELRGEPPGPCRVIIGIGINVAMPAKDVAATDAIDQPWIDLLAAGIPAADRNRLVVDLLQRLNSKLEEFLRHGFAALHNEWQMADALRDKPVRLSDGARQWEGISRGVATDGALLVELPQGEQRFFAGDVSLRERT